ncbi:oxidoreductase [Thalassiosira pseudonana CCMP1335]|uniref:D-xylose 1-dehydrogenase (NADP(+), D-xylono-1,5-lactone-forming) n=1 Tax=Thalassiosira pseudonana TaxID=35128 RepID=B8LCK0_THAPS|nr:oxidoreductase [Thalassiosira pseudonana CCMP1335]EED86911.1 oxidoreductase [Thalassiosira pseudonana CCMP1335]
MLGATSNIIHKSPYPLRWGILGPGRIANDFTSTLLTSGCTVSAVASSSLSRAQSFAQHFGIPSHYGSYEELASDPNVDIVYVATTNQNHLQPTLLMLRHGKNVLVEKPTTITYEDTRLMYAEAEKRGLFLMTNHWTRFFPLINNKVPRNYQLGKVVAMHGDFGFPTPLSPSDRFLNRTLGGGVTLDVGCYLVELALLAAHDHRDSQFSTTRALKKSDMKSRGGLEMDLKPDGVIATGHGLYNGLTFPVDVESSFSLRWGGGSYGIWNGECIGSAAKDDTTNGSKVNDNALCDTISIGGKKTNTPHITKETNSLDRFTMLATFQASFRRPSTFEVEYVFEHGRILIRGPGNCPSEMTIYEHEPFGPLVRETAVSFELPAVETAVRKYGRSNYPRAEGFVYVIEAIERCMAVRGVPGRDGIGEGDGVDGGVGCLELEENTIEEQLVTVEVTEEVLKKMGYLNFG